MDIGSGILTGSDNLYKYLFTGGLLMIVIAIVYPLQKQQEIELEINVNDKEAAILNQKLRMLSDAVDRLTQETQDTRNAIDSLDGLRVTSGRKQDITIQIRNLQSDYNRSFDSLRHVLIDSRVSNVVLEYNNSRIGILRNHKTQYEDYFSWIFWVGVIISILGFVSWSLSTLKHEGLLKGKIKP